MPDLSVWRGGAKPHGGAVLFDAFFLIGLGTRFPVLKEICFSPVKRLGDGGHRYGEKQQGKKGRLKKYNNLFLQKK